MKYAIVENKVVVNIAIADTPLGKNWVDLTGVSPTPNVGDLYKNDAFVPVTVAPVVVVAPLRRISIGAFFDRFGTQKYPILASTNLSVQALIKDSSVRKFIDLDNAQLPYGLALLVSSGYAIDSAAIINAPILDIERV